MSREELSYFLNILSIVVTIAAWATFAVPLLQRSRLKTKGNRTRDPLSWAGLFLQGASYFIVLLAMRSPVASPLAANIWLDSVLQIAAILLAAFSAWLAVAAIRELGKQWSLQARVLQDRKLVTSGVYGMVRHPIYTAMSGMLLATGLAVSQWLPLGVGIVLFFAGTMLRIRLEEGLLANAFGEEFSSWRAKVPALVPGPGRR